MFMPKKDLLNHSKRRLLNQICCGMGGRSAEEIVMGDITSGASGDIRMVTSTARHMVCDWGMTELGPIAYGESQSHAYMGSVGGGSKNYSEETAQRIDKTIYDIVQEQYLRSLEILKEHRTALDTMAEALLEHETIDGVHVNEILEHGEMRSPIIKREIVEPKPESEEDSDEEVAKKTDEDEDKGDLAGEEAPAPTPA
jgi:cell division protease FtsH